MSQIETRVVANSDPTSAILAARRKRRLSQDALAKRVGVTKATISKWENESAFPEPATGFRLASALGIRFEEIYARARTEAGR